MNNNKSGENQTRHVIAGIVSAGITTVATNPLELVKTRLQSGLKNAGFWNTMRDIGIKRSFVCGLKPCLVGTIPHSGLYFGAYKPWMLYLQRHHSVSETTASCVSAFTAGAVANLVCNPFWVLKTRMSAHPELHRHMWGTFQLLRKEEGLRALFKGGVPSVLGALHPSVQFPVYEYCKRYHQDPNSFWALTSAAFISKIVATVSTYPLEVVRTTAQIDKTKTGHKNRLINACKELWKTKGIRGFYPGMLISLAKNLPSNMIWMQVYEPIANEDSWLYHLIDDTFSTKELASGASIMPMQYLKTQTLL